MSCTEHSRFNKAIPLEYEARFQELLSSAKEYLPYMPISSAKEGGAARHSGMVLASDRLKEAIVNAEKLLANYEN